MRETVKMRDKQVKMLYMALSGGLHICTPTPREASWQDTRAACRGDCEKRSQDGSEANDHVGLFPFFLTK